MSSETNVSMHNVIGITPIIYHYNDFSTYEWIATDIHGVKLKLTLFHTHCDALVIDPTITRSVAPLEKQDEDVTPTL